jgi:hypothetical protein
MEPNRQYAWRSNDDPNSLPLPYQAAIHTSVAGILAQHPSISQILAPFHPIKSATLVASLLTEPDLQANTLRLEVLIHLLVVLGKGRRKPSAKHVRSWLNRELGTTLIIKLEDPAEDLFISNVTTKEGNIRVFDGLWEGNDFYLQRILNVVSTLPDTDATQILQRHIRAMLRLSEAIAERRGLPRFTRGGGQNSAPINVPTLDRMKRLRHSISFSTKDLNHLSISTDDLAPFVFKQHLSESLHDQVLGESDLECHPIIAEGGRWIVLLPTAISIAVRRYVLKWIQDHGYCHSFDEQFLAEYATLLCETPILGEILPRSMIPPTTQVADKSILEFGREIDSGRYLHVIAIVDGIRDYPKHGFVTPCLELSELSKYINRSATKTRDYFRGKEGFKQGLTLMVGCGYGRPVVLQPPKEAEDWWFEWISAPDLVSFGAMTKSSQLTLWKLVAHERFLAKNGITIANANGLLNLYGWWSNTNFTMLAPPVGFGTEPLHIAIPSNCIADVRDKIRRGWDVHSLPLPNGRWERVYRQSAQSYFTEEAENPRYIGIDGMLSGELLGAWLGKRIVWWITVEFGETSISRDLIYRIWDAMLNWMPKFVPIMERYSRNLPDEALCLVLDFHAAHQHDAESIDEELLRSALTVSHDFDSKHIQIEFHDPFFGGFRQVDNIAERVLLRVLATAVLALSGETLANAEVDKLIAKIMPNTRARHLHFFQVNSFADAIRDLDNPEKLFVDSSDEARARLGLGWLGQNNRKVSHYSTAEQSVKFLNQIVGGIWKRLATRLQTLNRVELIEQALRHLEGVETERTRWHRTIRAVLALRDDKAGARRVAMEQLSRCNAADVALRLVIEMAVAESPLDDGDYTGILDMTPLMADALLMLHLGGYSDAIKKGVMDPSIQIDSTGDILTHDGFRAEVVFPLGQQCSSDLLNDAEASYDQHFKPLATLETVTGQLPEDFLAAFEAEFELTVDDARGVRETLENMATKAGRSVLIIRKRKILAACAESGITSRNAASVMLERFALWPRKVWSKAPKGFKDRDWYPWRFERRLSFVARPLIRLEEGPNPRYAVAPGLVTKGFATTVSRYHDGVIDVSECRSREMKDWIDSQIHRSGHAFAEEVFELLKSLGYRVRLEEKLSALLNQKFDKDWGDVDVLAWKSGGTQLFVIECKDLKRALTPNDMAEQLNRFSGQTTKDGKRDALLKHLDRCTVLKTKRMDIARTLRLNQAIEIRSVVCFSHPVPMQYVAKHFPKVTFVTIDQLRAKHGRMLHRF